MAQKIVLDKANLSEQQKAELIALWDEMWQGHESKDRVVVLSEGIQYVSLSDLDADEKITNDACQKMETGQDPTDTTD